MVDDGNRKRLSTTPKVLARTSSRNSGVRYVRDPNSGKVTHVEAHIPVWAVILIIAVLFLIVIVLPCVTGDGMCKVALNDLMQKLEPKAAFAGQGVTWPSFWHFWIYQFFQPYTGLFGYFMIKKPTFGGVANAPLSTAKRRVGKVFPGDLKGHFVDHYDTNLRD